MTTPSVCDACAPSPEDPLRQPTTTRGMSAATWLWAPARGEDGHLLLGRDHVVVHTDPRRPGVRVRARPGALPVPSRSVGALIVPPILPELPELDGLFAEARRVLRPHGLLTMAVPDGPPLGLRCRRLRRDVRTHWGHRSAVDHPDWLLTAADFAVMGDDRLGFRHPGVGDDPDAYVNALCAAGLLPSGLPDGLRRRLAANPRIRSGRLTLRRLVARR